MSTTNVTLCHKCNRPLVNEDTITTLGNTFHTTCLKCEKCSTNLINGFHFNSDHFYCGRCVTSLVPNCAGCKKIIGFNKSYKACDLEWHADCIVCDICKRSFENGRHYPFAGKPYCLQDYWNRRVEHEQLILMEQSAIVADQDQTKQKKKKEKVQVKPFSL